MSGGRLGSIRKPLRALLRASAALLPAPAQRPTRGRGRSARSVRPRLEGAAPLRRRAAFLPVAHGDRRQHLHGHAASSLPQHADRRPGAHRATPVGVVGEDTSEELVLAAVDGELVHRALDRLSTRHRHVLAMREGSGWTYQQIADHEGVEIGTIETLLWRARQALKREFAVVSESKEALAGFLIATGALIRRTIFRAAHRGATVHHNGSSGGSRLRRPAQRRGGRCGHRRSRRGSIHRATCALERPERRSFGTRLRPGRAPPLVLGSTASMAPERRYGSTVPRPRSRRLAVER